VIIPGFPHAACMYAADALLVPATTPCCTHPPTAGLPIRRPPVLSPSRPGGGGQLQCHDLVGGPTGRWAVTGGRSFLLLRSGWAALPVSGVHRSFVRPEARARCSTSQPRFAQRLPTPHPPYPTLPRSTPRFHQSAPPWDPPPAALSSPFKAADSLRSIAEAKATTAPTQTSRHNQRSQPPPAARAKRRAPTKEEVQRKGSQAAACAS